MCQAGATPADTGADIARQLASLLRHRTQATEALVTQPLSFWVTFFGSGITDFSRAPKQDPREKVSSRVGQALTNQGGPRPPEIALCASSLDQSLLFLPVHLVTTGGHQ